MTMQTLPLRELIPYHEISEDLSEEGLAKVIRANGEIASKNLLLIEKNKVTVQRNEQVTKGEFTGMGPVESEA